MHLQAGIQIQALKTGIWGQQCPIRIWFIWKWIDGKQSYQVLHYLTQLDGSRRLYLAESLYGEPGDVITPETKAPEGYEDVEPITHTLVQGSVEITVSLCVSEKAVSDQICVKWRNL